MPLGVRPVVGVVPQDHKRYHYLITRRWKPKDWKWWDSLSKTERQSIEYKQEQRDNWRIGTIINKLNDKAHE